MRLKKSIRNGKTSFRITFKSEGTLSRLETEIDITETQFGELRQLCGDNKPLKKHTLVYPLTDGLKLEVSSVNAGEPSAFMYAEVEFPTEEAASKFIPLPFLGKEITEDLSYKMNNVYAAYNSIKTL